ncbi:MAG: UDP-N-acetylmuramate--alanine ligase [Thiomicrorhabdus sp.]|nr:MAG: UDP-N-acetylmuramate--alanine ligase [Thiomicrorhabdus sp.]
MKDQVKQIHFVGIGGVGMAGIAEVCLNLGYVVTGSDVKHNPTVARLEYLGALIQLGHEACHVKNTDVVVVSTAIAEGNPEVDWAREARVPVIPRAEMLAELMRMRFGIAIAGTHGKTTTTSLTAAVLTQGGIDPTYVIGGKLNQTGSNARLGSSKYLVAEADESDASFLHLTPMMSVITNIDEDHMDTYQGDYQNLENTFIEFIHRLPFYGMSIVCIDDENIQAMLPKLSRKISTYGFSEEADIRAINVEPRGLKMYFQVLVGREKSFDIVLNSPGRHNVLNALAAISIALKLDVPIDAIQQGLLEFAGVGRRFEVYTERTVGSKLVTLVDDYGHHPTELFATIETARAAFPDQRLVLVFQPHRYSRTRDLFDEFVNALLTADLVILTEVYSAGEAALPMFDSKALLQAMRVRGAQGIFAESFEALDDIAADILQDGDVLLVMGAGDVGQVAKQWQLNAVQL